MIVELRSCWGDSLVVVVVRFASATVSADFG